MDSYGKIAVEFVKDRFGDSIGPSLLRAEYSIHNIHDIKDLNLDSQVHFMKKFLTKKFIKFLKPQEVEAKVMQLNIQYSAMKALEKMSIDLRERMTIKPLDIRMEAQLSTITKVKELAMGAIIVPFHLTKSAEADIYFFIKGDKTTEITRVIYHSENKGYEYGKTSVRATTKFVSMFISKTVDFLNRLMKKEISLDITSEKHGKDIIENFLSKFQAGIFYEKNAFFTELHFNMDSNDVKITAVAVFRKNGAIARTR